MREIGSYSWNKWEQEGREGAEGCQGLFEVDKAMVLTPVDLYRIRVALETQVEQERQVLNFLEKTRIVADDLDWHEQQVKAQRLILNGYDELRKRVMVNV